MTICLDTVYTVVYIESVMETEGKEKAMETKTAQAQKAMTTAKVYHVKDVDGLSGRSLFFEIAYGEAAIVFEVNHELVAEVAVEVTYDCKGVFAILDKAFELTNNIHDSWTLNEGVTPVNPHVSALGGHGRRSTNSGDVVTFGGDAYVCAPMGWEKITSQGQRISRGDL